MKIIANENVTEMKKNISTGAGKIYMNNKIAENAKTVLAVQQMSHGSHRSHSSS